MPARLPSSYAPLLPTAAELERAEIAAAGRAERAQRLREHLLRREARDEAQARAEAQAEHYRRSIHSAF
jgi:hypothetical protein